LSSKVNYPKEALCNSGNDEIGNKSTIFHNILERETLIAMKTASGVLFINTAVRNTWLGVGIYAVGFVGLAF
jgi:hypothetical protein